MNHLRTIFAALFLAAAPVQAQTLKSLMYNTTNGQVVASTGTNVLTFTSNVKFDGGDIQFITTQIVGNGLYIDFDDGAVGGGVITLDTNASIAFQGPSASITRTNLGLGATWLTNANVTNFRTAIGLGTTNSVQFQSVSATNAEFDTIYAASGISANENGVGIKLFDDSVSIQTNGISFSTNAASGTRTNLGLGATNIVTFAGLTNNGDITINQTTTNNGLLFIRRTNSEAFLGMANLIASNNTTISNETLFRVGVSEATNKAAQFGFRSTNTNGNGVAVFSVFGFNALMMVGADASTNAVIYSGGGTNNEVMTLIRDGATEFARPIRFSTNAATKPATNAPTVTTNVAAWVEMRIGTNSYRVPLYQ